jgi:hypothetical protein
MSHTVTGPYTRIELRNLDPVNVNIFRCAASSQMALDPRHPIVGESSLSRASTRKRATRNSSVRDTSHPTVRY